MGTISSTIRPLLLLGLLSGASYAQKGPSPSVDKAAAPRPGAKTAMDDGAAWKAAEETVHARFTAVDGAPPKKVTRYNAYPGFFTVDAKRKWDVLLAHKGEVFVEHGQTLAQSAKAKTPSGARPADQKLGLARAGEYFRDINLIARAPKNVDLQDMLDFFDAFPNEKGSRPRDYVSPADPTSPDAPKLVEKNGALELTVTYPVAVPTNPEHRIVGRQQSVIARWTLTIPPTYQLSWKRQELVVDNK